MRIPKVTSSQRWAAGAVGLALLFACSPQSPSAPEPTKPAPPSGPQVSADPVNAAPAIVEAPPPAAAKPGYAGMWAASDAECTDPLRASEFSAETINYKPEKAACQVKSLSEETPTGRSMIYTIEADCTLGGQPSHETIKLNFGASDTVMQMVLGKREPVRLVRCP
ncbi:MAG TPA: hypothetical protein VGO52_03320 [Hyphomonadaceae bacterium]|jgi:hypothetical protein|nr:hypothetical protein [Hyphomonadaceae bacterium]